MLTVIGDVLKQYPPFGQRRDVHVVVARAVPDHELDVPPGRHHLPRDLDHVDHHDVGVGGLVDDLLGRRLLELVAIESHAALGHLALFPVKIGFDVVGDHDFDGLCLHRMDTHLRPAMSRPGPTPGGVRNPVQGPHHNSYNS